MTSLYQVFLKVGQTFFQLIFSFKDYRSIRKLVIFVKIVVYVTKQYRKGEVIFFQNKNDVILF